MATEETLKRRDLKEAAAKDFEENQNIYEKECFDTTSIYYSKMVAILESAKARELTHEAGFELHHKIPRSFFNKKNLPIVDKNNLYKLTYAQHFMVHYYAYMCATKFMKSAMSLALLDMKKMCTKVDGCTEENALALSQLFDNVKNELYFNTKKDCKEKSLRYWKTKCDKLGYIVEDIKRYENEVELLLICKKCNLQTMYTHTLGKTIKLESCSNFACSERDFESGETIL